jgi:putative transposase
VEDIVLLPKYRREVFTPRVLKNLKLIFEDICKNFECSLEEFNGEGDHVHLLISYNPQVSLSKLINSMKGVSSRLIRREGFSEVQKKAMG